jgi:hypothetical protein
MIFRLILATLLLIASTEVFGWNYKITHKTITETSKGTELIS